jgi:hypothetical protein
MYVPSFVGLLLLLLLLDLKSCEQFYLAVMMKIFFSRHFCTIGFKKWEVSKLWKQNIMACDSCANVLVIFVQDEQPDVQGLAVTLVSGRNTTESAIGMNFCTFLCFLCQFLVVAVVFPPWKERSKPII